MLLSGCTNTAPGGALPDPQKDAADAGGAADSTEAGTKEDLQDVSDGSDPSGDGNAAADGIPAKADSLDQAVIRQVDEAGSRLLLYSRQAKKSYLLTYDSATTIKGQRGEELVAGQLQSGDLITVSFVKDIHQAKGIWLDENMERTDNITRFALHIMAGTVEIGDQAYSLSKDCIVLSRGKQMEFSDINESDTLSAIGTDKEINALVITRGHGYVRLLGADAFEGGFVEFGQDLIREVGKDALYVVPEGSYQMLISKGHDSGMKEITVIPDEETQVDVSDIITDADRTGQIVFTITPAGAMLKIDDEEKSYSDVVVLSYGIHKVVVSMEGYQTVTQYIKVGEPMANLSIDLEEGKDSSDDGNGSAADPSVSGNTAAANVATASSDGEYRVYIDGPAQAELYVDDVYIGVVPTSFAKKSGKHIISLRRDGFVNRSYTLEIDDGKNDNHYSFSSLKSSSATTDADLAQSALSTLLGNTLSGLSE